MHVRALARLAALTPLLLAGCKFDVCLDPKAIAGDKLGSVQSPIIGGTLDLANHATVALLSTRSDGTHALCSGTFIAKHGNVGYVLTAAHCVTGTVDDVYEATDWRDCTPAGDASKCRAAYVPTTWQAHPDYDPAQFLNDFAIVTVTGVTAATEVVPAVEGPDAAALGEVVELSGFGRTYSGPNDPAAYQSKRNHVSLPIGSVLDSWLRFDASQGKTACFGDSGGPTYAYVGGARRVVGVASAADATCEHVALYGRVSSVYDGFIRPIISPALAGDCNTCLQSQMASVAACQTERDACEADANCATILTCVGVCVVPDQACYVACASPHLSGTPAFNQLANCAACSSCSSSCNVPACNGSGSGSGSSSAGTGGSSETTGVGGAGGASGSGGAPGTGGIGGGDSSGTSGGNLGSGGAASGDGGSGGSGSSWLGSGGFGGSESSSTASAGGGVSTLPDSVCVPLQLKCTLATPGEAGSTPGASFAIGIVFALGAWRRARRNGDPT